MVCLQNGLQHATLSNPELYILCPGVVMLLTVVVQPVNHGLEAVGLEDLALDLGLGTHCQGCNYFSLLLNRGLLEAQSL